MQKNKSEARSTYPSWPQAMCLRTILNSWCSVLSHKRCDYGCVPPRPAHCDSCLPSSSLGISRQGSAPRLCVYTHVHSDK